jgi:hypothetical protein
MRILRAAALLLLAGAVVVPAAAADGLPVLGVDVGAEGIAAGGIRYVALPAPHRTLVAQTAIADGRVLRFRYLRTRFTIPAVAYDRSAAGLSADGKTLVLIQPRASFPRKATRLAVLGAQLLREREVVRLQGDYSFDAVSPDGRTIYLIHYLSAKDPTIYEVRAYDLRRGRLLSEPIVDPHETGEEMRGNPLSRATSADGRWAYTLYDGAGGTPFVHALDTVAGSARCVDLDLLAGRNDIGALHLALRGTTLRVEARSGAIATVDTGTFEVRRPARTAAVTTAAPTTRRNMPWLPLGVLAGIGLLGAGGLAAIRRQRLRGQSV